MVTTIIIDGNQYTNSELITQSVKDKLAGRRLLFFAKNNIFLLAKSSFANQLQKQFQFDKVVVYKKYLHTLVVAIVEKRTTMAIISGVERYDVDLNGMVVRKASEGFSVVTAGQNDTEVIRNQNQTGSFPALFDQSNTPLEIGQQALPKSMIDFISNLTTTIEQKADFNITHFSMINATSSDLDLATDEGWIAKLKIDQPMIDQVNMLFLILQDKIKDRKQLKYIDVRFGDKVYYQ